jgi:alanine dehydrogenase
MVATTHILSAGQTRDILPMPELIAAVGRAFEIAPAAPRRLVLAAEGQDWVVMPGPTSRGGLVCKVLRVGHGNDEAPRTPTLAGVVVVLDADGRLIALLDAAMLTARRTAAAAAYATRMLAREDASVLALFGTGSLAAEHVEAIATVRPLSEIRVVGRSRERARTFSDVMSSRGYAARATDSHSAMRGAHIVVAVTTSEKPVFAEEDVEPSLHINAMGSYRAHRAEIPAATVARARVIVETKEAAWHEAGDLIQPRDAGLIDESHIYAELHERDRIASLRAAEPDAITLFKSVGHVALDLAALEVGLARLEAGAADVESHAAGAVEGRASASSPGK